MRLYVIIVFYELAFELAIGVDAQGSRYQLSSKCTPVSMGRHPVTHWNLNIFTAALAQRRSHQGAAGQALNKL